MTNLKRFVPATILAFSSLFLPLQLNFQANSIGEFSKEPISVIQNANAAVSGYVCINSGYLNVRSGPSQGYRIVGKVYKHQSVSIIKWSDNGDWVLISANNNRIYGWVAAWLVCL
ncbi:MAG: SH3 domain-containing protein [Thermales bacterium]|nr:SH3 domain-containing protein [Thermales bacterium]